MIRNGLLACITALFFLSAHAETSKIERVIYITLDGVRWQDIYQTQHYFPKLWEKYAKQLTFYGAPNTDTTMEVASIPLSLPSYQSQMSGAIQPCSDNKCGRIQVETLPEYLMTQLHLSKKDVVVFSSWPKIANAIEKNAGTIYNNAGNIPVTDPETKQADSSMAMLNHAQEMDHPGYKPNRYDKYTFSQALHYFQQVKPRFMWISLVNADDEAHFGHLQQYHQLLSYYDDALDGLFSTLKAMHLDKTTMVIVTTDHGRGNQKNWTSHGSDYPESRQTWAFVMNGKLVPIQQEGRVEHYNTLSIRPAIEKALI
jgi:hypothetical protein